ncbi:exodeoxyribonuclease I [Methylotuvimicrobium alcaliphilum]|uniref:Exodeoxyribonuclease I n=1 Tax=Methylotuvimicrobium alcaliphilum (strain DSM 19304 / NCIMB 14124 / VKM B-2133 / 20Z) TaxID=1091494 RepID=G4STF4_META2|nr:exodeoxyribonuclease I [Methylotuvimicrobium alcaliphilum]CCE23910.1 Exodeoxyribonuclease I [Methylotuvimicrobium alcaliphilum 20Z]
MAGRTFYWHDYETFGIDPRLDRPVQFAGIRTDYDFNVLGDPLVIYCKPALDCLPDPVACLITGITPQIAEAKGICEAEFIEAISREISQPNTCTLGYNNIRFDDEVTRNTLYRNLYDPYQREWQNGNSRWDLIDVVRAAYALRPGGIEWPVNEEGLVTFRLEELTKANGIEHAMAHDALSDVYATIAVAKLVRDTQPKLYKFLFDNRVKSAANRLLQTGSFKPVVHISGKYAVRNHCMAVVLPICRHPSNSNGVVVYDLSSDPEILLNLSVDEIKQRIFTATKDLPEGVERIPLKTVHVNKCPVLAPIAVIRPDDAARLNLDIDRCYRYIDKIRNDSNILDKIAQVFETDFPESDADPDLMIYSGGFFSDSDKKAMEKVHKTLPENLANLRLNFSDPRLPEMFFRYRARNYPETLNEEERTRWMKDCAERLTGAVSNCMTINEYFSKVQELQSDSSADPTILSALREYALDKTRFLSIVGMDSE